MYQFHTYIYILITRIYISYIYIYNPLIYKKHICTLYSLISKEYIYIYIKETQARRALCMREKYNTYICISRKDSVINRRRRSRRQIEEVKNQSEFPTG